jgi:hypothetical protein
MLTDTQKKLKWEDRLVIIGLRIAAKERFKFLNYKIGNRDDQLEFRRGGPITPEVFVAVRKFRPQVSLGAVKYRLNKLLKSGHVLKHTTRGGHCSWWPVGLADDLRPKS